MELLTRAIYTIFNQRDNATFPDEKNTINYSTRLFDSPEDAKYTRKKHKEYTILNADEVITKIEKKEDLNSKIRIVDDEGPFLKHVLKVLDHLNKLMVLTEITDNDNKEYNKLEYYNNQKSQFSFKLAEPYKVQLNVENFKTNCSYHLAKYLYAIFDFKPLEKNVFVKCDKEDPETVKVYNGAKVSSISYYKIMNGDIYRRDQHIPKEKYSQKNPPNFRSDIDKDKLAELAVKHVLISKETFINFKNENFKVSEAFL